MQETDVAHPETLPRRRGDAVPARHQHSHQLMPCARSLLFTRSRLHCWYRSVWVHNSLLVAGHAPRLGVDSIASRSGAMGSVVRRHRAHLESAGHRPIPGGALSSEAGRTESRFRTLGPRILLGGRGFPGRSDGPGNHRSPAGADQALPGQTAIPRQACRTSGQGHTTRSCSLARDSSTSRVGSLPPCPPCSGWISTPTPKGRSTHGSGMRCRRRSSTTTVRPARHPRSLPPSPLS